MSDRTGRVVVTFGWRTPHFFKEACKQQSVSCQLASLAEAVRFIWGDALTEEDSE